MEDTEYRRHASYAGLLNGEDSGIALHGKEQ